MASTLIETININAGDFTDNFLTCPTCMGPYDELEHTPKLLSCSHTLCKSCLEKIVASGTATTSGVSSSSNNNSASNLVVLNNNHNSLSRSVAAADAAVAAINNQNSPRTSTHTTTATNAAFRCPICRETIVVPRCGGVASLPPSFIVNQLLDLVKHQRRDLVPRCLNHPNEELLFCETCDTSFCSICESHCRVVSNADHIVIPFSIAIKRMHEIFLFKSNQCINSFNLALSSVQREIQNLHATVENVAQTVDFSCNELKSLIDKRRDDLFTNLNKIKEEKTRVLQEQMKLIANEKQKVEFECKSSFHETSMESKLLGAQIQNLNEKLDCLRSLFEPRENSFINYEYKFNNVADEIATSVSRYGRFKVSNTYPPLCYASIVDTFDSIVQPMPRNNEITHSANLSLFIQIRTVDYYGQMRKEGGDPVSVLITDPNGRQQSLVVPHQVNDLGNGIYICKFVPQIIGKYRVDVSIFLRSINQMPIILNVVEHVESLWNFGGFTKNIISTKGNSERDFNMPISVRCVDNIVYVLDSGNNRIKLLGVKQGNFLKHIKHRGLSETSCTALAAQGNLLYTINWRTKLLCEYNTTFDSEEVSGAYELSELDEPICLMETFTAALFVVQDKKKLHLCSSQTGQLVYKSLEQRMKSECGIRNIAAYCGHSEKRRLFVADSEFIFEFSLDWLCEYKLDANNSDDRFTYAKYSLNSKTGLSTSLTSLNSSFSNMSMQTSTTSSSGGGIGCGLSSKGAYTSLWHDKFTSKLLAAKCDKQKTVIEIFNSETCAYEYCIETSKSEKPLRRVTSMCCTDDGKVVCVDLIQNTVKMFRFI